MTERTEKMLRGLPKFAAKRGCYAGLRRWGSWVVATDEKIMRALKNCEGAMPADATRWERPVTPDCFGVARMTPAITLLGNAGEIRRIIALATTMAERGRPTIYIAPNGLYSASAGAGEAYVPYGPGIEVRKGSWESCRAGRDGQSAVPFKPTLIKRALTGYLKRDHVEVTIDAARLAIEDSDVLTTMMGIPHAATDMGERTDYQRQAGIW